MKLCAFIALLAASVSAARADILIGDELGSAGVRRYRESDGAFLGRVGGAGEIQGGIRLGPDGNVYVVAEDLNAGFFGEILRFHPGTGAPLGALVPLGQNGFRELPTGLTFSNGSVFTTGMTTSPAGNGVLRFDGTTGAFQGTVVAPGTNGLGTPRRVFTMPGGDLLVTDDTRLNRYDKNTLAFVSTFVAPGAGGLTGIDGVTFGPDGNLYVSSDSQNLVDRFDGNTGAFLNTFVAGADNPSDIAFGLDGKLYALSGPVGPKSVKRYNGTTGAFIDTFLPSDPANRAESLFIISAPPVPEPTSVALVTSALIIPATARRRARAGSRCHRR